ncbi:MAG: hypothetical protein HYV32_05665 [Candidatus Kerfeldbacteria bacterium]|nr:hypothetical protein [Candidatus Kerfeldbacteria bacterium]
MNKKTRVNLQLNIFLQTCIVFGSAIILTIVIVLIPLYTITEPTTITVPTLSPKTFFLAFALLTALVVIISKRFTSDRFWKFFFDIGVFGGLYTTLFSLCVFFLPPVITTLLALVVPVVLLVARSRTQRIWLHNMVILLAVVGISQVLAQQFAPKQALIIIIVLGIYDIIAVYYSHHMVTIAKILFQRHSFFGVIIPLRLREWRQQYTHTTPGEDVSVIGAGDIAFPIFFALSHLYRYGFFAFWVMVGFIFLGMISMHLIYALPKNRKPLPALAPLGTMLIVGYAVVHYVIA